MTDINGGTSGKLSLVAIGIDDYQLSDHIRFGGVSDPALESSVNDAARLYDLLRRTWGERMRRADLLLTPWPRLRVPGIERSMAGTVTCSRIIESVRAAAAATDPDDTLIVYCAGHGICNAAEQLCFVARAEPPTVSGAPGDNLLPIHEILEAAEPCAAKQRLLILDCCQEVAGDSRDTSQLAEYVRSLARDWMVLQACSPGEFAYEGRGLLKFGVFMECLVETVNNHFGKNGGGIDLLSLSAVLSARVPDQIAYGLGDDLAPKNRSLRNTDDVRYKRQQPVLFGRPIASTGPGAFEFAPGGIPSKRSQRTKRAGPAYRAALPASLLGRWPVDIPLRPLLLASGLCYGAAMATSLAAATNSPLTAGQLLLALGLGLGSVLIFWLSLAHSVSANEGFWHPGGWISSAAFPIWGFAAAALIHGASPGSSLHYVMLDQVLFSFLVAFFGVNAFHTLLTFAEMMRAGERGDPGHLARTFGQYVQAFIYDMDNVISVLAIPPPLYWAVGSVAVGVFLVIGRSETQALAAAHGEAGNGSWLHIGLCILFVLMQCAWFTLGFRSFKRRVLYDQLSAGGALSDANRAVSLL